MTIYEKIKTDKEYLIELLINDSHLTLAWRYYCDNVCQNRLCEESECDGTATFSTALDSWLDSEIGDKNEENKN